MVDGWYDAGRCLKATRSVRAASTAQGLGQVGRISSPMRATRVSASRASLVIVTTVSGPLPGAGDRERAAQLLRSNENG